MFALRRSRPTLRCLNSDLGLKTPTLDVDLGSLDHPWFNELRRAAPVSPRGQKRVLSIERPLVYRLRVSDERGATWVDDDRDVLWLCAVRRRETGSKDDAFVWFADLHAAGKLLPTDDDQLRDDAEKVLLLQRQLSAELHALVDEARTLPGVELTTNVAQTIPCRVLVLGDDEIDEIWCALSVRTSLGEIIRPELRDILFARLEEHLAPVTFESRSDWPTGNVAWYETVRLGLR